MERPEDVIKKIRINRMDTLAFSGLLLRVGYLSGYLLYVLLHLVILVIFLNSIYPHWICAGIATDQPRLPAWDFCC